MSSDNGGILLGPKYIKGEKIIIKIGDHGGCVINLISNRSCAVGHFNGSLW